MSDKSSKVVVSSIWQNCLSRLETELTAQQYNTWIKPLQLVGTTDDGVVYAPNKYILDTVERQFLVRIKAVLLESGMQTVALKIGSQRGENRSEPRPSALKRLGRTVFLNEKPFIHSLSSINHLRLIPLSVGARTRWPERRRSRSQKTWADPHTTRCCCMVGSVLAKPT